MHYLGECAIHRFVLSHELIQEDFKGVDPNFDRRLTPVPLLLSHGLLQDVLKQSIEVFVADAFTIIHLGKETLDHRKSKIIYLIYFGNNERREVEKIYFWLLCKTCGVETDF